jgi:hypothetical protein
MYNELRIPYSIRFQAARDVPLGRWAAPQNQPATGRWASRFLSCGPKRRDRAATSPPPGLQHPAEAQTPDALSLTFLPFADAAAASISHERRRHLHRSARCCHLRGLDLLFLLPYF